MFKALLYFHLLCYKQLHSARTDGQDTLSINAKVSAPMKGFLHCLYFWNEIKSTEKNVWQKVCFKEVTS